MLHGYSLTRELLAQTAYVHQHYTGLFPAFLLSLITTGMKMLLFHHAESSNYEAGLWPSVDLLVFSVSFNAPSLEASL